MQKRGLSTVVITLIIILISLVAVGIIWVVVRNVIQIGTKEVTIGQFTLDAKIKGVNIFNSTNNVSLIIKRNPGVGEFNKMNFVFSDGKSSEVITQSVSLNELEEKWFMFHLGKINVSELKSISIFPYVKQDEKEILGNILDKYTVSTQTSTIPTCTPLINNYCSVQGYACGNWTNGTCSGILNCGSCTGGQVCNSSGRCVASCTPLINNYCSVQGYECGYWGNNTCSGNLSCGTCGTGYTCNASGRCVAQAVPPIQCGTLGVANAIYTLTSNVNSSGTCFTITAQNIILDCNGYMINFSQLGAQNTHGVYTNQMNTTVKNCNIYDGNWTTTNTFRSAIYYSSAGKGTIKNNNLSVSNVYGIWIGGPSNSTIINNIGRSNSGCGFYISSSSGNNLTNNIGISNSNWGIYLASSLGNNLTNNIGISNSSFAIEFDGSSNNTLINNIGISNLSSGIDIRSSKNNILINTMGISGSGQGISLFSSSDNNILINCTGRSNSSYGIRLETASNNRFYNPTAVSLSGSDSYGIYMSFSSGGTGNNLFQDCVNVTGITGDVYLRAPSPPNQTFLNCSYNSNKESIGAGAELIRKWYYRAYVQNAGGNPINNVNVTAFNRTSNYNFNLTTGANGYTSIGQIIDYVNNGTKRYYSNYNISSANTTFTRSHLYNVTSNQNNLMDIFIL